MLSNIYKGIYINVVTMNASEIAEREVFLGNTKKCKLN